MSNRLAAHRRSFPIRRYLRWAAALLVAGSLATPAAAQTSVDLQLALMVDASGSVNQTRFELQKRGYVAALRDPKVLGAILGGRTQSIAIALVQWTGPFLQRQVLPWTLIKDEASAKSAAAIIEQTPRQLFGGGTSISGAVDHAMSLFPQSPFKGERRVIDVSGDGANNAGRSMTRARDEAVNADVTINGLPILEGDEAATLEPWYRDHVIGGRYAFLIPAAGFRDFERAMRNKFMTEISALPRRKIKLG
jgi:Protein of unknown function (DUF1194)